MDPSGNPIPDVYDPRKLTLLSRHQVAFWDETHPKVIISTGKVKKLPNKNVEVKFPWNEDGTFDIFSKKYAQPSETIVNVKYDDEIRLCLGVALVRMPCGKIVCKRSELIDYADNVVISEEEQNSRIKSEIEKVEKNKGKNG